MESSFSRARTGIRRMRSMGEFEIVLLFSFPGVLGMHDSAGFRYWISTLDLDRTGTRCGRRLVGFGYMGHIWEYERRA